MTAARWEVHKTARVNELVEKMAIKEQAKIEKFELDKLKRRSKVEDWMHAANRDTLVQHEKKRE